jgi:hypothetical protein
VVVPTLNTITLVPEDISPGFVTQNDSNVGVLSMRMSVDKTSAKIDAIRVNRLGTANDSDINVVKVWKDSNDNCLLDAVDVATSAAGVYPNLMSYGNESYASGMVNIVLKRPISVTTAPACAFISYDMSQFAIIGSTVGLTVGSAANFTVGVPNLLVMSTWPVSTLPMEIKEIASEVTLGVNDTAASLVLSGGVRQAQTQANMLRFNLVTAYGNAKWSGLKVQRTGASNDPAAPFGKNSDVKFVQIYQDFNQNDILDVNDVNISEARASLVTAFASTDTLPFNLVLTSTIGFPVSGRLYVGEAELVTYSGFGPVVAGKPSVIVVSRGDMLGDTASPVITHAIGAALR